MEIEKRSFEIISHELSEMQITLPADQEMITKRVIHTSADFDYIQTLKYSKDAVAIAKRLISEGADIVTDTNMALSGINKKYLAKFGGQAHCFMADDEVALIAKEKKTTRAAVSMEFASRIEKPVIFAIGNAPTALIELYDMIEKGIYKPAFVIGVPVGFVNVEAAKELIMRYGFTTGSCAAAASKAAAYMLLTGKAKNKITIQTPKGIAYTADITDIKRSENEVSCAVMKDGGDDPDVTTGAYIYASVRILHSDTSALCKKKQDLAIINIDGGDGVGRVTKPGLDQPVGNAAINHVPREMIEKEVREVCELLDFKRTLDITISVPKGKELAEKTFNPRLGIVGGISILGTSGIVEPMSSQALIDTIRVELRQRYSFGYDYVAVAPGNYGLDFMKESYGYDLDRSVKCSNFIGETIDMAADMGFKRMLLTGHIGKLIKVAGGIMNTHSREADCRIELLTAFAFKCGVAPEYIKRIMDSLTTEEALAALKESGRLYKVMDYAMERICFYLDKRAKGRLEIDCIMYSNEFGELAKSRKAEKWFTLLAQEQAQQI